MKNKLMIPILMLLTAACSFTIYQLTAPATLATMEAALPPPARQEEAHIAKPDILSQLRAAWTKRAELEAAEKEMRVVNERLAQLMKEKQAADAKVKRIAAAVHRDEQELKSVFSEPPRSLRPAMQEKIVALANAVRKINAAGEGKLAKLDVRVENAPRIYIRSKQLFRRITLKDKMRVSQIHRVNNLLSSIGRISHVRKVFIQPSPSTEEGRLERLRQRTLTAFVASHYAHPGTGFDVSRRLSGEGIRNVAALSGRLTGFPRGETIVDILLE